MKKRLPLFMVVKRLREDLHLTQEGLAEKSGISAGYIRQIEGGYTMISGEFKKKLAAALNISVWALFPDVPMEVDLFGLLENRFGRDLVITESEVPYYKETLSRLDQDQFGELIGSAMQPADVKKRINQYAKEFNIEVVE